ncbi:fumarylacetoacetate hydrolase family protein [Sphingomonas oligophenolica]|uniref:Fumarylacetoacetate hydrolase family protein n=1 Tax=Sphingomonas oligophenolica TaxID=301154 RepID=A0ABU9YCU8_9SPHN
MPALIEAWPELSAEVATWPQSDQSIELAVVRLLAPVPRPGKILGIGLNYVAHARETNLPIPEKQIWFAKATTSVNGPFDPVQLPKVSTMVDYEVELVAVIGRRCRHVSYDEAHKAIFGYCVGNDVSARDWQGRTPQWTLGKSFDTHAPFGPWLTTADEVGNPHRLDLSCKVNGESRQASNTSDMVFNVFDQIAELSQVMTLEPGDVIYTGTPSGVGMALSPPRFLEPGDRVTCEIERLGVIEAVMTPE